MSSLPRTRSFRRWGPPAPSLVSCDLGEPTFLDAISVSLYRLLAGLGLGVLIGIPLGAFRFARHRRAGHRSHRPAVTHDLTACVGAPRPRVVCSGTGSGSVIALIALAAVWPIVLGVSAGVRALDPWVCGGRTFTRRDPLGDSALHHHPRAGGSRDRRNSGCPRHLVGSAHAGRDARRHQRPRVRGAQQPRQR